MYFSLANLSSIKRAKCTRSVEQQPSWSIIQCRERESLVRPQSCVIWGWNFLYLDELSLFFCFLDLNLKLKTMRSRVIHRFAHNCMNGFKKKCLLDLPEYSKTATILPFVKFYNQMRTKIRMFSTLDDDFWRHALFYLLTVVPSLSNVP
jgi:hypothetical protein